MAYCIYYFKQKIVSENHFESGKLSRLKFKLKFHHTLMLFFFIGYFAILIACINNIQFLNEIFVGIILFMGAIFVLLGINLQSSMLVSLRENYVKAIKMLIATVEVRDPYTIGHSEHVANLSVILFDRLPEKKKTGCNRNILETTGLLHDIGKIGVPESILNKPGRLNIEEFEFIKQHVSIGRNILNKLEDFGAITDWILYHHERVDGKGYLRLTNKEIPIASKIIAVADTYSALVTDRPYRKGKSNSEAKSIISKLSGSQLDPDIVTVFLTIEDEILEKCRPEALVLEYLENLQCIENQIQTSEKELSKESGLLYLERIIPFSIKNKIPLTIVCVKIKDSKEIENKFDYHEIDEISLIISGIFVESIRNTDILVKFERDRFLLVLTKCLISDAMKMIKHIFEKISTLESISKKQYDVALCKKYTCYDPDDKESKDEIMNFYENLKKE